MSRIDIFQPQGDILARKKPYTKKLFILDAVLTLLTGGNWLVIVLFRELWRWS